MNNPNAEPQSVLDRISVFLATGCYAGFLPPIFFRAIQQKNRGQMLVDKKVTGAGLLGSVEGALTFMLLPAWIADSWVVITAACLLAVVSSSRAEKALGTHDDSRIVIDEWLGCWIALWGLDQKMGWVIVWGFILFRIFDVLKGPIGRRLQKLPGGWGVTMDDVYAGIAANVLCRLTVAYFPAAH